MLLQYESERIPLAGGELLYWPRFLETRDAEALFECIRDRVPWVQSKICIAGRQLSIPRLNAWYGDSGTEYGYSGTRLPVNPWLPELDSLKSRVARASGSAFNCALLNLYRDGRDSVDWHSDNEPELGRTPIVATLSLGAERRFDLRPRRRDKDKLETGRARARKTQCLHLPAGSLLVMAGDTQRNWQHRVPKLSTEIGERISVTFRYVESN